MVKWQQSESLYLAGKSHLDVVDALATQMEAKWGVGRLRLLVSGELCEKFDSQAHKLDAAIQSGELEDVKREAGRMVNAWMALDSAAEADSKHPLAPEVWEVRLPDGKLAALVRSVEEAHSVVRDGRAMSVYTLDEIARLIQGFPSLVKAKEVFPGAAVARVTHPVNWEQGDEVPVFGI